MKKLSNTEAELQKSAAYKKPVYFKSSLFYGDCFLSYFHRGFPEGFLWLQKVSKYFVSHRIKNAVP